MALDIDQIAEAFCSHRFAEAYPYMADDITWKIVGADEIAGRDAVIERCTGAQKFLETVSTTPLKLKTIRAETCVVVEGAVQFQDQQHQITRVASCDVFRFSGEKLVEITSYVIDLPKP